MVRVVGKEGIPITGLIYYCMCTCFLSVMILMSEQVVHLAVVQCIFVEFLIIENVKPAEILTRLRAQFGDGMLSRTQVYD